MQWCLEQLTPERQNVYRFYQLELGEDGTTFRRIDDRLVFHPILAPYLVCDLIEVYKRTRDANTLRAARQVADSALARGKSFIGDSLVFWYTPQDGLSKVPGTFYSGLTQAWYIRALCKLAAIDSKYAPLIPRVFRSFTIPVDQGGVLLERSYGWVVEEYPHQPALYTLNGWLTVLRWVAEDRSTLRAMGCPVEDFLARNLDAVENLLPLYDLPSLYNTRYQLTGFVRLQLVTDLPLDLAVRDLSVSIPGEGQIQGHLKAASRGRWHNYIERTERRMLQLNVVLSMSSAPDPNVVTLEFDARRAGVGSWRIADADYDPLTTALPTVRWKTMGNFHVASGGNRLALQVPMDSDNLVAYPTNFLKRIHGPAGLNYNGYHFVHTIDLAVLYKLTGRRSLKEWGERWLSYISHWPSLPYLPSSRFSHKHYTGMDFERSARKFFDAPPLPEQEI